MPSGGYPHLIRLSTVGNIGVCSLIMLPPPFPCTLGTKQVSRYTRYALVEITVTDSLDMIHLNALFSSEFLTAELVLYCDSIRPDNTGIDLIARKRIGRGCD